MLIASLFGMKVNVFCYVLQMGRRKPDPFYNLANYMLNEVMNCEEIGYDIEWERKSWIFGINFGLKRLNSLFFLH